MLLCDGDSCLIPLRQSLIVDGSGLLDFDVVVPRHGSAAGEGGSEEREDPGNRYWGGNCAGIPLIYAIVVANDASVALLIKFQESIAPLKHRGGGKRDGKEALGARPSTARMALLARRFSTPSTPLFLDSAATAIYPRGKHGGLRGNRVPGEERSVPKGNAGLRMSSLCAIEQRATIWASVLLQESRVVAGWKLVPSPPPSLRRRRGAP